MRTLHIDLETYSSVNIADCGLYKYAEADDFGILLIGYAVDNDPVRCIDTASGEAVPEWFLDALTDPGWRKAAHNAVFERVCLSMYLRRIGRLAPGEFLDPYQWHCTMVQCSRCGLPLSLAQAGAILGLERQKMTEGKALIELFCKPQKRAANTPGLFGSSSPRALPGDFPEKWATFKAYNIRDVEAEREIDALTSWYPVSDFEQRLYAIDQNINDRGVLIDLQMVSEALKALAARNGLLTAEAMRLTGLSNPNSVTQLREWLSARLGVQIPTLTKKDFPAVMDAAKAQDDSVAQRVIEIRSETGKASNAKYEAMRDVACRDGRARGLFQFHGARTGRWAGRLIQMQNLPQNHIPDLDFARNCLKAGDTEMLQLGYGNVNNTVSELIRTAFIAAPGKTLAVCDFSAIEARVLAWVAEEPWVLDVFRNGGDIYCATASQMFHVPVEKHGRNAGLRQKGKIAVLALGYGGGVGALDAMGGQRLGMTEEEEKDTVQKWRQANPNIVKLWKAVEAAATKCAVARAPSRVGRLLFEPHPCRLAVPAEGRPGETVMTDGTLMTVTLPSGRMVSYPMIGQTVNRFGSPSLRFAGLHQATNKWTWVETHGGKLVENIIQATARDCLAVTMTRAEKAGFPVVFHIHDELICETEPGRLEELKAIFATPVDWAPGLPLVGAGYETPYYLKD